METTHTVYTQESKGRGTGLFSRQSFKRGQLVMAEARLFSVDKTYGGPSVDQVAVISAVNRLAKPDQVKFQSLRNSFAKDSPWKDPILETYSTNAFNIGADEPGENGIFELAARINHSCLPNARHSFHAETGLMRVYALKDIEEEEELSISYLSGVDIYGTDRNRRTQLLRQRNNFTCVCSVCSAPSLVVRQSNARRNELARIYDWIQAFGKTHPRVSLRLIQRAIALLDEEGFAADKDDFTLEAASICAMHVDWGSAKAWAATTMKIRSAEFGHDSQRVRSLVPFSWNPKMYPQAGQSFAESCAWSLEGIIV